MNEGAKKCAHLGCNCRVDEAQQYCSPYCRNAGEKKNEPCNCGHPGCGEAAKAE